MLFLACFEATFGIVLGLLQALLVFAGLVYLAEQAYYRWDEWKWEQWYRRK